MILTTAISDIQRYFIGSWILFLYNFWLKKKKLKINYLRFKIINNKKFFLDHFFKLQKKKKKNFYDLKILIKINKLINCSIKLSSITNFTIPLKSWINIATTQALPLLPLRLLIR